MSDRSCSNGPPALVAKADRPVRTGQLSVAIVHVEKTQSSKALKTLSKMFETTLSPGGLLLNGTPSAGPFRNRKAKCIQAVERIRFERTRRALESGCAAFEPSAINLIKTKFRSYNRSNRTSARDSYRGSHGARIRPAVLASLVHNVSHSALAERFSNA